MKLDDLECRCNDINLDEYINYREMVKNKMDEPHWLGDFTKDKLISLLNNNSKIWIYYLNNEFICSMMLIPSDKETIHKFGIDLDYRKSVDYGPMFVNPKYVGKGLQLQMLKKLDKYAIELGYKFAVVTIHPDNIYSINNIIKDNFTLEGTKEFTRGVRNIYLKRF